MLRRRLADPLTLLLLFTGLLTFLIQSGELGTSDTMHRLQVAHSLWTGQPQVFPSEYPEFGLHGRGGHLYAWYGIGQSLLLLPIDIAATAATHLPLWHAYVQGGADPAIRSILVSFPTNILLAVLTAFTAFRLLQLFGFNAQQAIAGTLALLCATTHLHYSQNMTENNYILLLTLAGLRLQYLWLVTGSTRALRWGAGALGLNLLTRLTTMLDILGVAAFLLLAALFSAREGAGDAPLSRARVWQYVRHVAPVYLLFLFLDRLYQFLRFGSWTNNYFTVFGQEQRRLDPSLPANFPFNGHPFAGGLHSGILGPLFAPEKSIFLFDPLFPLALLLTVLLWKQLTPTLRAFSVAAPLLVAAYLAFYSHFIWWAGDFAWGDRYPASVVELGTLLVVPLLMAHRRLLSKATFRFCSAVLVCSAAIQAASLAFWVPLEIYQMETLGHPTVVVWLRLRNVAALALGRRAAWGLNTPAMFEDPWDAAHITTWNFLPSLLRHIGAAPRWAVDVLDGVWIAVACLGLLTAVRLYRVIRGQTTAAAATATAEPL